MAADGRRRGTIRDAQNALESATGTLSSSAPWSPLEAPRGGVTWQVPSTLGRGQMSSYPHTTGPNPNAAAVTIGSRHHLTDIQAFPAASGYAQVEETAAGVRTPATAPSPWHIVERVHHEVLPGGRLGPAQHDQHLAINMVPNETGVHEVRSATVRTATHAAPGEATIRTDSAHQPLSPRTARRVL